MEAIWTARLMTSCKSAEYALVPVNRPVVPVEPVELLELLEVADPLEALEALEPE
jgi:hypothetical protein